LAINTNRLPFPKRNRLLVPGDYQRVFKQGHKQNGSMLTLVVCANEFTYPRLGLAIAKRFVPLAVNRNRVRRIIRERFRHSQSLLGGVDVVVFMKREMQEFNNTVLQEDLQRQWQRLLASLKICS
jgi:ribonuclease P protein component